MSDRTQKMTTAETFDARINTDGLTIIGQWNAILPKPKPPGHCVYQPTATGDIKWVSTEPQSNGLDISL